MIRHLFSILALALPLSARPNVLFLAVDDLRPELGSFGASYIHSPAMDAIAASGRAFQRHYVQAPTCGASRYALLTGRYARTAARRGNNAVFNYANNHDKEPPALPELFRKNGYRTISLGKISHHPGGLGGPDWNDPAQQELPNAWDFRQMPGPPWKDPKAAMHAYANGKARQGNPNEAHSTPAIEHATGDDKTYTDGWIAEAAIRELNDLSKRDQPFFLAVGLMKPHLPFACPKNYRDRYTDAILPAVPHPAKPEGLSTWHESKEFMQYNHNGRDPRVDPAYGDEVRRSYAACVTYADTQIAKIMARLEELKLTESTIIVLWGDHGYHLGEHGIWGKHSLFEESLRAPLVIRTPGMTAAGGSSQAVVETVDIYPTLGALCEVPLPDNLDGRSLVPMLDDPEAEGRGAISYAAGKETFRNDRHRLIRHQEKGQDPRYELYDHRDQPGETRNIANENPDLVRELAKELDMRLR
jgi:iduronate 2-sulfatase